MVSQAKTATPASRDRLLAAGAVEFSTRGYDGAKVDRIAARARVNKAMLYYHFHDKAALYREILADVFRGIADAVSRPHGDLTPEDALRVFIRAIAAETTTRPHFPAMWLRELADGGRHLDPTIIGELGRILKVLGAILHAGQQQERFKPANPMVTQMGIVAPLLIFSASAAARTRLAAVIPHTLTAVDRADVIAHIEDATLAALRRTIPDRPSTPRRPRR